MKRIVLLLLFLSSSVCLFSQVSPEKYYVEFTDRNGSPYSLSNPLEFLSQRALDRRQAQGISLAENDLPVNPSYVQAVSALGVTVLNSVKWFNAILIQSANPSQIAAVEALPFVKKVLKNKMLSVPGEVEDKFREEMQPVPGGNDLRESEGLKNIAGYDYGRSYNQISMLKGDKLHELGYRGQGKIIAVLDAGFMNADILPVFDSLRQNGRILGTRDFVSPGGNVYAEHPHGMMVLSAMGGNLPGSLVGTAPWAQYWLLRSEDANSEYIIEEYNWVAAAAFADSAGADIINSSLGYAEFNDSQQNHSWEDMLDGDATPCAQGANLAASKGILVVNSAGNSGESTWRYLTTPADATNVVAVGAVDSLGVYASFSSHGWVTSQRVKPNVAAQGKGAIVSWSDGSVGPSNGTSFSSPILAGTAASLWSGLPGVGAEDLKRMIEQSASQYNDPDTLIGYGIPNFLVPLGIGGPSGRDLGPLQIIPNPSRDQVAIRFHAEADLQVSIGIYSQEGRRVFIRSGVSVRAGENQIGLQISAGLPAGNYLVKVVREDTHELFCTGKMIRSGR